MKKPRKGTIAKAKETAVFWNGYIAKYRMLPTFRDVQDALGINSTSTVWLYLHHADEMDLLTIRPRFDSRGKKA